MSKEANQDKIDAVQAEVLDELLNTYKRMSEVAEAEGTTAAFEKVLNFGLKIVPGLQVKEKAAGIYDNLPVFNIIFDGGISSDLSPKQKALPKVEVLDAQMLEIEDAVVRCEPAAEPELDAPMPDIDLDSIMDPNDFEVLP